MFDDAILRQAAAILAQYEARGLRLASAESCTGGLVAGALTEIAGSSAVVERGFVTYSNEAKTELLEVPAALIAEFGAVSEPVARKMAEGALQNSRADVAVAVTGIAGPGGGSAAKPVGLVHFGCARKGVPTRHVERRFGEIGRTPIRLAALVQALTLLEDALRHEP